MSKIRWIQKVITLQAGVVYEYICDQHSNTFLIRNSGASPIYADLYSTFTATNCDTIVPGNAWGSLINPNGFKKVYLMGTETRQIKVVEAMTEAPAVLLGQMMAGNVIDANILSTVGLTANQLNLDPAGNVGIMIEGGGVIPAENITIYNVVMAAADTQYSQAIPAGTKEIIVSIEGGTAGNNYRIAFEAGKVAAPVRPYMKIDAGEGLAIDGLSFSGKTLYIAGSAAGMVAQILCKV